MDGVTLTPEKIIENPRGNILNAMKVSSPGFHGFGEVYFSSIHKDCVKGWTKHLQMTLNFLVPVGKIEFSIYSENDFFSVTLSVNNYSRLTICPNIWVAFRGLSENNLLINIANQSHDPNEMIKKPIDFLNFGGPSK